MILSLGISIERITDGNINYHSIIVNNYFLVIRETLAIAISVKNLGETVIRKHLVSRCDILNIRCRTHNQSSTTVMLLLCS